PMLVLNPTQPLFAVTVDPSQIEWKAGNFTQVVVTLYTKSTTGSLTNVVTLTPFHSDNDLTQLYSYYFAAGNTPVCFYKAEYWVKDQPAAAVINETALSAVGQLNCPANHRRRYWRRRANRPLPWRGELRVGRRLSFVR